MDFDERYPAMFQPGGDGPSSENHVPEQLLPPKGVPAPPLPSVVERAVGRVPEVAPEAGPVEVERDAPHRAAAPETQWGSSSWAAGLIAVVLTFAAAAFCLFAAALIPAARSSAPSDFHGILMIPWGIAILPGAPALFTAGMGMLAALFLLASRHYPRRVWRFHLAGAAVGLVALAGGTVAMFSEILFAEMLYTTAMMQENFIPWYMVFQLASWQLLFLGLAILALTVVLRPQGNGVPSRASAAAALWTGSVLAVAGVWSWFAPQAFPLAEGTTVNMSQDQFYRVQAWTYVVGQAGGPLLAVGAATLFWGLLVLTTTRRRQREPVPEAGIIAGAGPGPHHP